MGDRYFFTGHTLVLAHAAVGINKIKSYLDAVSHNLFIVLDQTAFHRLRCPQFHRISARLLTLPKFRQWQWVQTM